MRAGTGMAMFARDSRLQRIESKLTFRNRVAGMTTETVCDFRVLEFTPDRLVEGPRAQPFVTNRDFDSVTGRIITHPAFVVTSIVLKYPGLHPFSESPADRERYLTRAV